MARKNPWIAAILSLVIAGGGQLYPMKIQRAMIFLTLEFITVGFYFYIDNYLGFYQISLSVYGPLLMHI